MLAQHHTHNVGLPVSVEVSHREAVVLVAAQHIHDLAHLSTTPGHARAGRGGGRYRSGGGQVCEVRYSGSRRGPGVRGEVQGSREAG